MNTSNLLVEETFVWCCDIGSIRLQVMLASAEEKRAQADKMADQVGGPSDPRGALLSELIGPSRVWFRVLYSVLRIYIVHIVHGNG